MPIRSSLVEVPRRVFLSGSGEAMTLQFIARSSSLAVSNESTARPHACCAKHCAGSAVRANGVGVKVERPGEFSSVLRDVLEFSLSGENPVWDAVMTLRNVVVGPQGDVWSDQFVRSVLLVCVAEGWLSVRSRTSWRESDSELSREDALVAIASGVSWELPTESSTQLRLMITDRGNAFLLHLVNSKSVDGPQPTQ